MARQPVPIRALIPGVLLLLVFSSCASLRVARDERNVNRIAARINGRDAGALERMSEVPFLLDQEIVLLPQDVAGFWRNALQAGFTVNDPRLREGRPLEEETYRRFADSMEVRTFFRKYLPKGTRLLELETGDGRRMLLLVKKRLFSTRIHGLKGPT